MQVHQALVTAYFGQIHDDHDDDDDDDETCVK